MKRCGRCGEVKPSEAFARRGSILQPWCRVCRKAYDAEYWQANKHRRRPHRERHQEFRAWYEELKRAPCCDCSGSFPPECMQWDHRPGEAKAADVGWLASRHARKRILNEIEKCDLVCANCHAVRTRQRHGA